MAADRRGNSSRAASDAPSTSPTPAPPSNTYAAAPDLAGGTWRLDFTRTNFGGTTQGTTQPYNIILARDDTRCASAPPCYSGRWYVPPNGAPEAATFVATVSLSASEVILSGTEIDYATKGPQHYQATASNDTTRPLKFTGIWHQYVPGEGDNAATFTFYRLP